MNLNLKKLAALFITVTVLITGCSEKVAPPATNQSVQRVEAAKVQQQLITRNQDLTNAQRRRDALNKPASANYLLLLNAAGQPIWYGVIDGKPSTIGKTVQPLQEYRCLSSTQFSGCVDAVVDAPDEYGLYSRGSRPGIYYFLPSGAMMEWTGEYLFSTIPLRVDIKPIAITLSKDSDK